MSIQVGNDNQLKVLLVETELRDGSSIFYGDI